MNVESSNVSSTIVKSLPDEVQQVIIDICDPYMQRFGICPPSFIAKNTKTANLITSSSSHDYHPSTSSLIGVSSIEGPPTQPILISPIFITSTSPNGGGNHSFSRISQSVIPPPPLTIFANATWRPKVPPCFLSRSSEDVHTWTSLVRHYLAFMSSSDEQHVEYTVTLSREVTHEWYIGHERRNRGPSVDWTQLSTALLELFGSNICP